MKILLENWNKFKLTESTHRLKDFAEIKTNFEGADFWIVRRGSSKTVGQPTTNYSPEHIGVKVTALDKLDAKFLKYMIEYLWSSGKFAQIATGTTALVNIKTEDIKNIGIG
jgi:hypothetical protein